MKNRKVIISLAVLSITINSYASTEIRNDRDMYMSPKFTVDTYQVEDGINTDILNNREFYMSPKFSISDYGLSSDVKTEIRSDRNFYMSPKFSIDAYSLDGNNTQIIKDRDVYMSSVFSVLNNYNVNYNVNNNIVTDATTLLKDSELIISTKFESAEIANISSISYTVYCNGEELAPKTAITIKDSGINQKVDVSTFTKDNVYSITTKIVLKDGRMVGFMSPNLYIGEDGELYGVKTPNNVIPNKAFDAEVYVSKEKQFSSFDVVIKNEITGETICLTDYSKEENFVRTDKGIDYYKIKIKTTDSTLKKFSVGVKLR